MAKITYTDKTTANTSPLPTTQKFRSADANEIKVSVNALYDEKEDKMIPFVVVSSGDIKSAYRYYDEYNSKPRYVQVIPGTTQADSAAASNFLFWKITGDSKWHMWGNGGSEYYTSADDVATPDLVTTWVLADGATAPLPTVAPYYGTQQDALEQLAVNIGVVPLEYIAKCAQSGTDAPIATILKNTLGVVPVWTREYAGGYLATSVGAFPVAKTETVLSSCSADGEMILFEVQPQDNNVSIRNVTGVDESSFTIHISVYP